MCTMVRLEYLLVLLVYVLGSIQRADGKEIPAPISDVIERLEDLEKRLLIQENRTKINRSVCQNKKLWKKSKGRSFRTRTHVPVHPKKSCFQHCKWSLEDHCKLISVLKLIWNIKFPHHKLLSFLIKLKKIWNKIQMYHAYFQEHFTKIKFRSNYKLHSLLNGNEKKIADNKSII